MKRVACVVLAAVCGIAAGFAAAEDAAYLEIERQVAASDRAIAAGQAKLSDRCSIADYAALRRAVGGTNVWTAALQAALDAHEIVVIPASDTPYYVDGAVVVPSGRRIEAAGATVALLPGTRTVLLRNRAAADGTLRPVPAGTRDADIAVVGGRWVDWTRERRGDGATGRFSMGPREKGLFYGVSTLFYFGNCDRFSVRDATFVHAGSFAIQSGDGDGRLFENITFDDCYADGLHLNGNLTRVHAKGVRGKVGDDLVALNAYDWLHCSVNFGPQRFVLCEDLELVLKDGRGYPAIRILPAKYRYADGKVVDCAISDVVFRRVKGITTFKMYLQTPAYRIGTEPEWGEVGSGGNLYFEDLTIDLARPIDCFGQYATSDPVRGHFGAFEFGANLTSVTIRNVDITFHADAYPLSHLMTVGPKSIRRSNPAGDIEVFDPYLGCDVGRVTLRNIRCHGKVPEKLVHATSFENVNGDGRSTGAGRIGVIDGDASGLVYY